MLLRDRLLARMNEMGTSPDYVRLAAEVLGIRNTPPMLAKRLVEQALVVEDRREAWLRRGEQICQAAPSLPGVYVLRDADGRTLYVGKANNIRRRLRTHFAARRWRSVKAEFARATHAEWRVVGSEIEALIREAVLIRALAPAVNVQVGMPQEDTRAVPDVLRRDTVVVLPSAADDAVELLAVRMTGSVLLLRVPRDGKRLRAGATRVWQFFRPDDVTREEADAMPPYVDAAAQPESAAMTRAAEPKPFAREQNSGTLSERDATSEESHGVVSGDALVVDECAPIVWSWLAGRGASVTRLDPHDAGVREFERRIRVILRDDDLFASRIVVVRSGRPRRM